MFRIIMEYVWIPMHWLMLAQDSFVSPFLILEPSFLFLFGNGAIIPGRFGQLGR